MAGQKDLVPYQTIKAAVTGDSEAINQIVQHYSGYITKLSTRTMYDEYGNRCVCVDEELREVLRNKLVEKILTFKIL